MSRINVSAMGEKESVMGGNTTIALRSLVPHINDRKRTSTNLERMSIGVLYLYLSSVHHQQA